MKSYEYDNWANRPLQGGTPNRETPEVLPNNELCHRRSSGSPLGQRYPNGSNGQNTGPYYEKRTPGGAWEKPDRGHW